MRSRVGAGGWIWPWPGALALHTLMRLPVLRIAFLARVSVLAGEDEEARSPLQQVALDGSDGWLSASAFFQLSSIHDWPVRSALAVNLVHSKSCWTPTLQLPQYQRHRWRKTFHSCWQPTDGPCNLHHKQPPADDAAGGISASQHDWPM